MITQTTDLDLIPGGPNGIKHIHVNQRDVITNGLIFTIWNGSTRFTLTSGTTATIEGTKPDGKSFQYTATVNTSTNTVIANLVYQMDCVPGLTRCELRLKKSGADIGTANFYLDVEEAGLVDNPDLSTTELPIILKLAKEQMEAAAASAKLSESWAVGGTKTRTGEDTNNSKYWSQQSQTSANSSAQYAKSSEASSKLSESWAIGGTGTREGEDTNNAKYYSEQADKMGNDWAKVAESWAIGNTGVRPGENSNNAKYYSEESAISSTNSTNSAILSESWAIGGTGDREGEDENNSKYWANIASNARVDIENYADICQYYANTVVPRFYLDFDTMTLYQINEENKDNLTFRLTADKHLEYLQEVV